MKPAVVLAAATEHPFLLLVSVLAWTALYWSGHSAIVTDYCGASALWLTQAWNGVGALLTVNPPAQLLFPWLLMIVAMMSPLLALPVSHVWVRSLARRRWRAVAIYTACYGAVWLFGGIAVIAASVLLQAATSSSPIFAPLLAIAVALFWQASPAKQLCLNRCHRRPPLATFGLAADGDCARFGLSSAGWCFGSCWALMLVPLVSDTMHFAAMAIGALVIFVERQGPARPLAWRIPMFSL